MNIIIIFVTFIKFLSFASYFKLYMHTHVKSKYIWDESTTKYLFSRENKRGSLKNLYAVFLKKIVVGDMHNKYKVGLTFFCPLHTYPLVFDLP